VTQRTVNDLRRLIDAGILTEELYGRVLSDHRGLADCWCGYDMLEHNVDAMEYGDGANSPIQDHVFSACGTKYIAWLLGFSERSSFTDTPFEHDHTNLNEATRDGSRESFCLLCRIEVWEAALGTGAAEN
jgi:hypothetical protein